VPETGWISVSGSSSLVLSSGTQVGVYQFNLYVASINTPRVRIVDSATPRRLQYAGSYGLYLSAGNPTLGTVQAVTWAKHVQFDFEIAKGMDSIGPNVETIQSTHAWWKFPPGMTCQLRVLWQ
jgi:hypothetical protein